MNWQIIIRKTRQVKTLPSLRTTSDISNILTDWKYYERFDYRMYHEL
jgi:hypothetical protein